MIHLISTSDVTRIEQALKHAEADDWMIFTIEKNLSESALSMIRTEVFTKFPNSAFLCENPTSERQLSHTDFITLCVDHPPVMSWY